MPSWWSANASALVHPAAAPRHGSSFCADTGVLVFPAGPLRTAPQPRGADGRLFPLK
jgi:hypothetical protein